MKDLEDSRGHASSYDSLEELVQNISDHEGSNTSGDSFNNSIDSVHREIDEQLLYE